MEQIKVLMSEADAVALLALLKTSSTFPDVVEELEERLAIVKRDHVRREAR